MRKLLLIGTVVLLTATSASAQSSVGPSGYFGPAGGRPISGWAAGSACPINLRCSGQNRGPLDPNAPTYAVKRRLVGKVPRR